jgi:molybdate/tungstate transport system substrate-binding protein
MMYLLFLFMFSLKKLIPVLCLITCIFLLCGCSTQKNTAELKVFHAGSLTLPLGEVEKAFELEYPGVDIQREGEGSVKTVRKVTDIGKHADVVAVADYSLIPQLMYPDCADWYISFAGNSIVLAYKSGSGYAGEINRTNWFNILQQGGVVYGMSNPNDDPCGYRTQMVIQLAEEYYKVTDIYENLITRNMEIESEKQQDGTWLIRVPSSSRILPGKKIMMRSMEVELCSALEMGEIDYLFIYKSVAEQHGFNYLDLPVEINLGSLEYEKEYGGVSVRLASGEVLKGKPILYGLTIPKNALNRELAVEFVRFLLTDGQWIMEKNGQVPLTPPITDNQKNLPDDLEGLVIER